MRGVPVLRGDHHRPVTDTGSVPARRPVLLRVPIRILLPVTGAIAIIMGLVTPGSTLPLVSVLPATATSTPGQEPAFSLRIMELPERVDRAVLSNLDGLLNGIPDSGGAVVARVTRASTLVDDHGDPTALDSIFDHRAKLAVQVALPSPSGAGAQPDLGTAGSLLLAMADHRFADADEARAALSRNNGNNGQKAFCKKQCQEQVTGTPAERASGMYTTNSDPFFLDVMLKRALLVDASAAPTDLIPPAGPSSPGHDDSLLPTWAYVVIVVVLLGLGVAAFRRRDLLRRSEDGRDGEGDADGADDEGVGRTDARPVSPVSPPNVAVSPLGTVHSPFDPQGYVAVDGGLYRATWIGPGSSRPRVGDQVRLRMHEMDGLQAWPAQGRSGLRP